MLKTNAAEQSGIDDLTEITYEIINIRPLRESTTASK